LVEREREREMRLKPVSREGEIFTLTDAGERRE